MKRAPANVVTVLSHPLVTLFLASPLPSTECVLFSATGERARPDPRQRVLDRVTENAFRHLLLNPTSLYTPSDGLGLAPARFLA